MRKKLMTFERLVDIMGLQNPSIMHGYQNIKKSEKKVWLIANLAQRIKHLEHLSILRKRSCIPASPRLNGKTERSHLIDKQEFH